MNASEFDSWLSLYFGSFPDTGTWMASLADSSRTLASWRRALEDVSIESANEVTYRMERGDIEPPKAYERERTAITIRMESKKIVVGRMPERRMNYREERFDCAICQDRGSVTIWSHECVKHVQRHKTPPTKRTTDIVACACKRGNGLATEKNEPNHKWKSLPRYDEAFHCRTIFGTPGKADVKNLLEWVGAPAEPTVTLWEP